MTVSGAFERLKDNQKEAWARAKLLSRHPHLKEFLADPDAEVICIKIRSFLLLDGLTDAHFEEIQNESCARDSSDPMQRGSGS